MVLVLPRIFRSMISSNQCTPTLYSKLLSISTTWSITSTKRCLSTARAASQDLPPWFKLIFVYSKRSRIGNISLMCKRPWYKRILEFVPTLKLCRKWSTITWISRISRVWMRLKSLLHMRVTTVNRVLNSMTTTIIRIVMKTKPISRNKREREHNSSKSKKCKKRRDENRGN